MRSVEDLARIVYAFFIKKGDAKRNLTSYLQLHLRPEIFSKVEIGNILKSISKKVGDVDVGVFLEDIVDMLIRDKIGDDIEPLIVSKAKRKFNISSDKAHDIIGTRKSLDDKDGALLKDIVKEYTPMVSQFLLKAVNNRMNEWVREHKDEPRITDDTPEPSVLPEHELEDEMKKEHEWEEGLIKDVIDLINRKVEDNLKPVYKLILKDMFLAKKPKAIPAMAKEVNMSVGAIHKYRTELARMLATFLSAQGLGGNFIEDGGMVRKEIVYPKYQEFLKDSGNSKDFKEFVEDKFGKRTQEDKKKIVTLLAEGKSPQEVVDEDFTASRVRTVKFEAFDPWYKEWYAEKVEEVRKANFYVRKAFMMMREANITLPYEKVGAKRVTIPFEKKEKPEEDGKEEAVGAAHESMVDKAIDKHRVVATIYFTANYDNLDVIAGRKDPAKDPVDFKYLSYEASLALDKKIGKTSRTVDYRYTQDLKPDGSFTGNGESTLSLDGTKVSHSSDLKKELDNYVEHHMKPEGMLPYGRAVSGKTKNVLFPVGYENKKTGKDYTGVRNFVEKHRGLLVEDAAHGTRKTEVERRELEKTLPISEQKKLKETIFDFKDELQEEKRNKPPNTKRIKEIEEHIKKLESLLKGEDIVEDIDAIIEKEMKFLQPEHVPEKSASMILPYEKIAAVFPPPESGNVKKLMNIFDEYKVTKPKPTGWLIPYDLLTLAKALKGHAKGYLDTKLKDLKKQKGLKKDDKELQAQELESKVHDDLRDASGLFDDIPADLKKRLGKLGEKDRASLSNTGWVNDQTEIDRIIRKIRTDFAQEVKAPAKKPETMRSLEKGKYDSLEAFLETAKDGIKVLAQRLNEASLTEVEMDPGLKEKVEKVLSKEEDELKDVTVEISEGSLVEKEKLQTVLNEYVGRIKVIKSMLDKKEAPALSIARAFSEKLKDFAALFNYLASTTWYGQYAHVTKAAEELAPEDIADLKVLRGKIYNEASILAKDNIFSKNAIKSGLAKLREYLKKFIKEYSYFRAASVLPYPVVIAEDENNDFEKARTKAIFPEDEMSNAKKLISDLKKDEKTKTEGDKAQSEFNNIIKNVSQAYKDSFSNDKIKAIAEREEIPFNKASVRLKKIQDSIARKAISDFIIKWKESKDIGFKENKERSGLGNKLHTEYDAMGDFVERHLPGLFELTPPEKVPEEPARGVATPKAIREFIEEAFSKKTEEKFDIYGEGGETPGKGSGPRTKGRKKAIKPPPPNITLETIKDRIVQMFDKPAEHIVLSVMAFYVKRIKDSMKALKDGEYIDAGDVIDGLISLLKQLQFNITNLKVEPSASAFRVPPKGAPQFSGKPDIAINSSSEAKKVFDKIMGIYKTINKYIAPDQVGMPPADLSNIRKPIKKYLPIGLTNWYQHLEEQEKGKKSALSMASRIAEKFAGTDIRKVDNYVEEDLITIN